ncbi:hypothetical protein F5Y10DRAFT_266993 [Nemania abortiva]|nr:hypothetical protein F5Y10DRAFT_266993 [Nemania abortiva]
MSLFARNYVPIGLAIVFGIVNGFYAFQPLLKEQRQKSNPPVKSGQQPDPVSNDATSK